MSCLISEERKEQLFDEALTEVENEFPNLSKSEQESKADDLATEKYNDEVYFSYSGHPSLSPEERNR